MRKRMSLMVIAVENESSTRVQNLDEAICVSLHGNAFRKGMNQSLSPPTLAMGKYQSRQFSLGFLSNQSRKRKSLHSNLLSSSSAAASKHADNMDSFNILAIRPYRLSLLVNNLDGNKYPLRAAECKFCWSAITVVSMCRSP